MHTYSFGRLGDLYESKVECTVAGFLRARPWFCLKTVMSRMLRAPGARFNHAAGDLSCSIHVQYLFRQGQESKRSCTCIHVWIQRYMDTYGHVCTYTYSHVCKCIPQKHAFKYVNEYLRKLVFQCAFLFPNAYIYKYIYINTYIHTYLSICAYTHIYIFIYTHTHTYTYTCT